MSDREDILQGAREWLKTATGLDDEKVIPANDKGPRPALPYMTVKVTTHGLETGTDETSDFLIAGDPFRSARGTRRGSISVQAFGLGSEGFLEEAHIELRLPPIDAQLQAAGLTIFAITAVTDLAEQIDTEQEARYSQDFQVDYLTGSKPAATNPFSTAELDMTLEVSESDPDPLISTITVP